MTKTNKSYKQIFSVLLSLLIIFMSATVCNAAVKEESEINPCYVNIARREATLKISGIKANCSAKLYTDKSQPIKIKMELQKEKSNGYETVKTWESSKTGTFLAMSESRNINIFSTYRLKVTFTAGAETIIVYKS